MSTTQNQIDELKKRVRNLEETMKTLLVVYSNFVSNKQVQELIAAISDELAANKQEVDEVKTRLDILEDIPDIDI